VTDTTSNSADRAWRFTARYEIAKGEIYDQQRQQLTNELAHLKVEHKDVSEDRQMKSYLISQQKTKIGNLKSLVQRVRENVGKEHLKQNRKHRGNPGNCMTCAMMATIDAELPVILPE